MRHTIEVQKRIDSYTFRAIDALMDAGYEIISSTKDAAYSIVEAWVVANPTSVFSAEDFLKTYKKKYPNDLKRAVFVPKLSPAELEAYHEKQRIEHEEAVKAHRQMLADRRKAAKEAEIARVVAMTPKERVLYRLEQQKLAEEKAKAKAAKEAKKNEPTPEYKPIKFK